MDNNTVINTSALMVVGITCRTSNDPDAGPQDIPRLWGRFFQDDIINKITNKVSNAVVALYCDYDGDHTMPYSIVIGCPVSSLDSIPDGMVGKVISTGPYAKFCAIGEYPKSLIDTWGHIWQQKDLKRTYTGDYELYSDTFFTAPPQPVDVYIAIAES